MIEHIGEVINERLAQKLPTYFSIAIEQYGKLTPVVFKQENFENFKKLMLKYTSNFELNSIQVELFNGKSRNAKNAFQTFRIPLKKEDLKTIVVKERDDTKVEQLENSVSIGRYYDEKFEYQRRILVIEMEKTNLLEKVNNLIEKYEDKLKAQEEKQHEKVKELEEEIESLNEDIHQLEKEIAKNEREKHNSLGNIALGTVGAKMMENFAKSEMGMGVIKGLLGTNGFETLQGHLKGIEQEQTERKETSRIITKEEKGAREIALEFIQKVGESLDDQHLRMLYDIAELTAKNIKDIEVLWNLAKEIEKQRNKPVENTQTTTQNPVKENEQEDREEDTEEDTEEETKIE